MYVIADIEWITNSDGHQSPTQFAAVRVDENWNAVAEFDAFIKPRDSEFHDWKHVAYTGGSATDFLCAKNAYIVLSDFQKWLNDDDVILWWYDMSDKLFKKLVSIILKIKEPHNSIIICDYVYEFISGEPSSDGNPYNIAQARGIVTDSHLKNNSKNDIRVLRELMEKIKYPQSNLLNPLANPRINWKKTKPQPELKYQRDPLTNTIHISGCPLIDEVETVGCASIMASIRKGNTPCDCCLEDYQSALRERNLDIIERSQYNYIYSPESSEFHKPTCETMLLSKSILGTGKYRTAVHTGRTPCKLCKPTAYDDLKPLPPQISPFRQNIMGKDEMKAISRQRVASEERSRRLREENLTKTEIDDIYTLTQPRFAFWAGQGYQTFHIRSCPKLQELSNLEGFATYNEAISAGYSPCRHCKPTAKHDVTLSVPITNKFRDNESFLVLETLCIEAEYPYKLEGAYFCLETPVGKWKININTVPIKLKHINLAKNPDEKLYHDQPRIFLSYTDTFNYIKRHDDELIKKVQNSKEVHNENS